MSERQINKVRYDHKEGQTTIEYSMLVDTDNGIDTQEVKLTSYDKPEELFLTTLAGLAGCVEEICKLPAGYCAEATIKGVTFSHKHDIMGATITALVPVDTANAPVVINTPFLPSDQYNEGGQSPTLPYLAKLKLNQLLQCAGEYIDGKRQPSNQLKMDLD